MCICRRCCWHAWRADWRCVRAAWRQRARFVNPLQGNPNSAGLRARRAECRSSATAGRTPPVASNVPTARRPATPRTMRPWRKGSDLRARAGGRRGRVNTSFFPPRGNFTILGCVLCAAFKSCVQNARFNLLAACVMRHGMLTSRHLMRWPKWGAEAYGPIALPHAIETPMLLPNTLVRRWGAAARLGCRSTAD